MDLRAFGISGLTAERFEQWCRTSSWLFFWEQCLRLEQRRDISGTGPRKNTVRKCHHCQSGAGYPTVCANMTAEHFPGRPVGAGSPRARRWPAGLRQARLPSAHGHDPLLVAPADGARADSIARGRSASRRGTCRLSLPRELRRQLLRLLRPDARALLASTLRKPDGRA